MSNPEVTFVLPCLDEAETLGACLDEIRECIEQHSLSAEIVVADNGSTDGSQEIAEAGGARVVHVPERGYGAALMGGFDAARGDYLIMGDSDMSYDFRESIGMIEAMRNGADLAMGSRFQGTIQPGAMPWLHRWLGNPVLSFMARFLFRSRISDFHCGMRGLTAEAYRRLGLRTTGMEFATEMGAKAATWGLQIDEVPITLRPDGRSRPPHLRRWRDGWRHVRFMLILSPKWTLGIPGILLSFIGAVTLLTLLPGPVRLGGVRFDVHSMVAASMMTIVGYQAASIAVASRVFSIEEEIGPVSGWLFRAAQQVTVGRGLIVGSVFALAGLITLGRMVWVWAASDFGDLVLVETIRPTIVGATLLALGAQTVFMALLYSMLRIPKRSRQ